MADDPLGALGNGITLIGASCLVGGLVTDGVAWIACGAIAGTSGVIVDSGDAARKFNARSGAVTVSDVVGFVCGSADAISKHAVSTACSVLTTFIGIIEGDKSSASGHKGRHQK